MRRSSIFGWSLPPGVSRLPGEEPDPPCAVCAMATDDCVCPECPTCGECGNPRCYLDTSRLTEGAASMPTGHGLRLSRAQVIGRAEAHARRMQDLASDAQMQVEYLRDGEYSEDLADNPDPWR